MNNETVLNNTYRILRPIGSGGVGEIYLGYHLNLRKYVVIKKVKDHCTGLLNNRTEVDILKGIHHTYLPQVYDFIQIKDGIFTVIDYISGHDLKYYLDAGYRFSEEQLILWMKQLCQVLDYLHTRKPAIIHCDIKPGNIMITEEGNVCLIDFNISLDGENNKDLVGLSSLYASPEQIKKAQYKLRYGSGDLVKMDERTDLYSLGAVFYFVMTGIKPNAREGAVVPLRHMEHYYSDSLANIIDKAMEPEPSKRFKSASRMLEALEHKEKWSGEYQRLFRVGAVLDLVTGCLALILICLMVLGYSGMRTDDFFEAYDVYMDDLKRWESTQDEEEADTLVAEGIRLLNQSDYSKKFKNYTQEKANVLYGIGQASLYLEDYWQAEKYLEEALTLNRSNPVFYRDLAITQTHLGNMEEAEDTMNLAMYYGLSTAEGNLIQAEIAMEKKEYEKVWQCAQEAAGSEDVSIVVRASQLVLEAGERIGATDECIQFIRQMSEQADGAWKNIWLRKAGELCMKSTGDDRKRYLEEAVNCFETIRTGGYAQLTDLYNLVSAYNELERLDDEKCLLEDMAREYPDEYEVFLQMAYVIYRMQNNTPVKIRTYDSVLEYYEKACHICEEKGIRRESDTNMLQMEEIISQLKEQGWLSD